MKVLLVVCFCLFASSAFAGANLWDVMGTNGLTTLQTQLTNMGLESLFNTAAANPKYTIFGPTNAAFALLNLSALSTAQINATLQFHVIPAEVNSAALSNDFIYADAAGLVKRFNFYGPNVYINGNVRITTVDIAATNGVLHIVDAVIMVPTAAENRTITEEVVANPAFSTLRAALVATSLAGVFNNASDPYTVFAPTDAAFDLLPAGLLEALLVNTSGSGPLAGILTYHAVTGTVFSVGLSNGQSVRTLRSGANISVAIINGSVILNGNVRVTTANLLRRSGVIHVIDAVLVPSNVVLPLVNIWYTLEQRNLTTLQSALTATALDGAFNNYSASAQQYTLFAPTDAAFAAIGNGAGLSTAQLRDVLLFHTLTTVVRSTQITNDLVNVDASGRYKRFNIYASNVYINGNVMVTVADILASNGIVHIVDAVILPPTSDQNRTITEEVVANSNFTSLRDALVATNLASTFANPSTPYTVFAPTNAAFAALPAWLLNDLLADTSSNGPLAGILTYHAVAGTVFSVGLTNGQRVVTLRSGANITVSINGNVVRIDNATVTVANLMRRNGVIHVIDSVLVPGNVALPTNTIWDVLRRQNLTTLRSAITTAGLVGAFNDTAPTAQQYTVFAPTNAAFSAIGNGAGLTVPQLREVLLFHAIGAVVYSSQITNDFVHVNTAGQYKRFNIYGSSVYINGNVMITVVNLNATNGVVHIVDTVILPTTADQNRTITDEVIANGNFSTLRDALVAANLASVFANASDPYTVFAPTNAAFAAIPSGVLQALLADPTGVLSDILTYHAVQSTVFSVGLTNGQRVATVNGAQITVSITGNVVKIDNATVTIANLMRRNGVIHVIDAVMIPSGTVLPSPLANINDTLASQSDLTLVTTYLNLFNLSGMFADNSPTAPKYTVFAPVDSAFAALNLTGIPPEAIAAILGFHVIPGVIRSSDITNDFVYEDQVGYKRFNIYDTKYTINGKYNVILTGVDIPASNGIIHKIDSVMMITTADEQKTILQEIASNTEFSTLAAALTAANLASTFGNRNDSFTVFAPTNAAFNALPPCLLEALLADPTGDLTDILTYHVVGQTVFSSGLTDGQVVTTLNGDATFTAVGSPAEFFIAGVKISVTDVMRRNGVIHIIDAVMVPPSVAIPTLPKNLLAVIREQNLTTLEANIAAMGLTSIFNECDSSATNKTVFAPTEAAWAAIDLTGLSPAEVNATLQFHVLPGIVMSSDITNDLVVVDANGQYKRFNIYGSVYTINGNVQILLSGVDLMASNGVVHLVDAVITIPTADQNRTITEEVVANPSFTTLEAALTAANLASVFADAATPFTVFAPTDAAFALLPAGLIEALVANPTGALTDILKYHVVSSTVFSVGLSDGQVVPTLLADNSLTFSVNGSTVMVNGVMVSTANIMRRNGVIHVIDAVLVSTNTTLPPAAAVPTPTPVATTGATPAPRTPTPTPRATPRPTPRTTPRAETGASTISITLAMVLVVLAFLF